ncbi:MAG: hypothetical protein IKR69_07415 [Bacteroidales bacterium]|nr:hypothetical protein [Bacteroidales bacterium]
MKKILFAISLLLATVSCTKKLNIPSDPEIDSGGRTMVSATVADYASQAFVWPASARIGIYDGKGRSNCRYTIMNEYALKGGAASFYGMSVSGSLMAYYPFSEKGYPCVAERRQPVLCEQVAGESAARHLALNSILVAEASPEGKIEFSYGNGCTGLLHLKIKCSVEGLVEKVVLQCPASPLAGNVAMQSGTEPLVTEGSHTVTLTKVGRPCTLQAPLEVWAQVPSGTLEHLTVTAVSADEAFSAAVDGPLKVVSGGVLDVAVQAAPNRAGNEDLLIIDGSYE